MNQIFLESLVKAIRKIKRSIAHYIFQIPRIIKYKLISNIRKLCGKPICFQPVLFSGNGTITLGNHVQFGVCSSQGFYSTYTHIEARSEEATIIIKDRTQINNNACIISESAGIIINSDCIIGNNFTVFDSDFHGLFPQDRRNGKYTSNQVIIGTNVFIGSNVTILKGVSVGDNSVIAACSVVTRSIPSNVIAGGNPCQVIRNL